MANTPINSVAEKEREPSALENAAKILGIAVQTGGIANTAAGLMKPPTTPDLTMPYAKKPELEVPGVSNFFGGK